MKFLLTILSFFFLSFSMYAQVGRIVWEDNFDEGQLDLTKWSYETGTGVNGDWGTGQLDYATNRPENVSFQNDIPGAEDGCLVITTRKERYEDRNYTSGRIRTAGKASWGPGHRISARVFPRDVKQKGQGFAFWMMPDEIPEGWDYLMWPQGGEIDIMEYVGTIPFHNLASVHYAWFWENNQWQDWNHGHMGAYYSYETQQVPDPYEPGYGNYPPDPANSYAGSYGFHVYGIDMHEDRIEFFVDYNVYHIHYLEDGAAFQKDGEDGFKISDIDNRRVAVSEYSNHFDEWHPFEHKMYAILSAGVGGSQYTYGGEIVPEAVFPCSVFIDWVRVYELDDTNVGINDNDNSNKLNIYTDLSNNVLNIQFGNEQNYNVKVIDIKGNVLIHTDLNRASNAGIDVSALPKGIYVIWIGDNKFSVSKKIVI